MVDLAQAPGAGPSPGGPPVLPKSPVGGPAGPGGSPMLSPGGGAGEQAAAQQKIKVASEALLVAASAYPVHSKEQNSILEAVRALRIFGKSTSSSMVPAGLAAMAQAAKQGPMAAAPPPGLAPDASKPPPGMAPPVGPGAPEAA